MSPLVGAKISTVRFIQGVRLHVCRLCFSELFIKGMLRNVLYRAYWQK